MNHSNRSSSRFLESVSLILLAGGCVAPTYTVLVSKDDAARAIAPTDPASITISGVDFRKLNDFQIVGNVYVGGRGTSVFGLPSDEGLERCARDAAASLGASGILGYYTRKVNDAERWATGLAIRTGSSSPSGSASSLAIALWPIGLPEEMQDDAEEIHALVSDAARRTLAPKGYYLHPLAFSLPQPKTREASVRLPQEAEWIDLVLFVELTGFEDDYDVIARTRTTGMRGELHSVSKRAVVWEDDVESEQGVFSLLNSLLGVGSKKKSAALAIENLLATLPTLADPFGME